MKIPKTSLVRLYELTYLVPGSLTSDQVDSANQAIQKLCKKHSVKIKDDQDWGKKELAYTIRHDSKHETEAFYRHLVVSADPQKIQTFESELKLQPQVMRHLLVLAEEEDDKTKSATVGARKEE